MSKYIFEPDGYHIFIFFIIMFSLNCSYYLDIFWCGKRKAIIHIGLFLILSGLLIGDTFIQIEINDFRIVEVVESKYPVKNRNEILLLDEYSRFIKLKNLKDKSIQDIKASNKIYQMRSFIGIKREYQFKKIEFGKE